MVFKSLSHKEMHHVAESVALPPFPIDRLSGEEESLLRRLAEELNRQMSFGELATICQELELPDAELLLEAMTHSQRSEIERFMKGDIGLDRQAVQAKFSVAVVCFLSNSKDLSPELRSFVDAYKKDLQERLEKYCCELFTHFGLHKVLGCYSEQQWNRLAGLTPRQQLAVIAFVLDKESYCKLTTPLPERQKLDLEEMIALKKDGRERCLEAFGDVILHLKKWVSLVNKVGSESF